MSVIEKVFPVVLGLAFAAAGGYLYVSQQEATDGASDVGATILNSTVRNDEPRSLEGDYHPHIEYRFSFEGRNYTSDNICAGEGSACYPTGEDRSEVQSFVDKYPEGETATAHVPQGDPEGAYLEAGGSGALYLGLVGVGLLVAALGAYQAVGGDGES